LGRLHPAKAAALEQLAAAAGVGLTAGSLDDLASVNADLAISTLPGGTAVAFTVPPHLAERALLFDVAYDPWPSKL
ncbi:hypothetical protein ACC691_41795, partial [Rhizobium johnstonii]|uniref:hypothetical protein n=1 Tax=Rhizobium johnstonii TaxID=3019933 RepID=UPI003F987532